MAEKKAWGIVVTALVLGATALVMLYSSYMVQTAPEGETEIAGIDMMAYTPTTSLVENAMAGTAIGLFAFGVILAILTYFVWKENDIAWYFTVGILGIGIIADILLIAFFGEAVTAVGVFAIGLSLFVILALFHKDTISAIKPDIDYKGWDLKGLA